MTPQELYAVAEGSWVASFVNGADLPSDREPRSGPRATIDDLAAIDFEALSFELGDVARAYREHWCGIAVALTMISRSPDQCRDIARRLAESKNGGDPSDLMAVATDGMDGAAAWLRGLLRMVESGSIRLLCGAARLCVEEAGQRRRPRAKNARRPQARRTAPDAKRHGRKGKAGRVSARAAVS